MKPLDRNISILEHIIAYCDQIEETIRRFGQDYDVFSSDAIYRNAAALCILQIGELAGKLTEEFRTAHPGAPCGRFGGCGILWHIAMALSIQRSLGKF